MENKKHIHFIGIGGIGMSALARYYMHEGWQVSGSDSTESLITEKLSEVGAAVVYEQRAENITSDIDLVVYTEAMPADHSELVAAREQGIETINYFQALGKVANEYYLIAVAGSHGKSTTTGMLIDILEEAGLDPTAIFGSLRSQTGSNYRAGKSKYMLVEACEYKRDFLYLEPDMLIVTNLEYEHVDYYKDLADVQSAFKELAQKVPAEGVIVCDTADKKIAPVLEGLEAVVIDYRSYFDPTLSLTQPGVHNQLNAAAAKAAALELGVEAETAKTALENFAGIWRRFEYKGEVNGAPVYDDYAHHPTEVRAAIAGVREKYPEKKLTVVFQVHNASRALEFAKEFTEELAKADRVLLLPTYIARAENITDVDDQALVDAVNERGTEAAFFYTTDAAVLAVKELVGSNDVVMVMGAGDVTKIANQLT